MSRFLALGHFMQIGVEAAVAGMVPPAKEKCTISKIERYHRDQATCFYKLDFMYYSNRGCLVIISYSEVIMPCLHNFKSLLLSGLGAGCTLIVVNSARGFGAIRHAATVNTGIDGQALAPLRSAVDMVV